MALELVTTEEAAAHLRVDEDTEETWLAVFIPAISEAVATWLKDEWRLYVPEYDSNGVVVDSSGDPIPALDADGLPTPRAVVKAAVLVEMSSQYRWREGEGDNRVESMGSIVAAGAHGYILNKTSTALLSGLRKSTLA